MFRFRQVLTAVTAASGLVIAACAGNSPSLETRSDTDCPAGQVLVCKGGQGNSRIKDSKLNEADICICRQQDI